MARLDFTAIPKHSMENFEVLGLHWRRLSDQYGE